MIRSHDNGHPPLHVHVFKDGRLVARYDLEHRRFMDGSDERYHGRIEQALREASLIQESDMARATRSRMSQRTEYESASAHGEAPEPSGLALVASAIGRIARESRSEALEREGEQLVSVLRDWQEAHRRLEERARALRSAYEKVATQLDETERERQQWHLKYLECEKALKASPAAPRPEKKGKR